MGIRYKPNGISPFVSIEGVKSLPASNLIDRLLAFLLRAFFLGRTMGGEIGPDLNQPAQVLMISPNTNF
jgi:hypothetical protein